MTARLRLGYPYLPLVARAGVILFCVFTTIVKLPQHTYDDGPLDRPTLALTAGLLFCVVAFAAVPLPSAVPRQVPPLAETLAASIVIGALGGNGVAFLVYLLVPVFIGGLTAGIAAGLACSLIAAVVPVVASVAASVSDENSFLVSPRQPSWVFIVFAVGLLGGWICQLRAERRAEGEPAYADAHRLLSELHVVARQLSLGLDPRTLAGALTEDIQAVVPHGDTTVLARSAAGRFVSLVGEDLPEGEDAAVHDAWLSARPVRRGRDGASVAAIPVLMGERVVALVVVTTLSPLDDPALARCGAVIEQAGPRLASAMLFDDVRRLATVDERMRLAREIHDGIAQDLASVGYALDDIRRDCAFDVAGRVDAVREQLRSMVGDLRLSIFDLRTGVDDAVPLGAALSEYAHRAGGQAGLVVHASVDESPHRLPISVEVELLRIAQEAITNVRRHARARNLWLTVTVEPPNAHFTVLDDGLGMGKARLDSFGLTGMRERANRIGAELAVGPGPTGGTMVEAWLGVRPTRDPRPAAVPVPVMSREALTDPRGLPSIGTTVTLRPTPGRADQEVT